MTLRAVALGLALTFGLGSMAEAKTHKPVVHKTSKAKRVKPRKAKRAKVKHVKHV